MTRPFTDSVWPRHKAKARSRRRENNATAARRIKQNQERAKGGIR